MSHGIGPEEEAAAGANVENCFVSFFEPHCGQDATPSQWVVGTSNSNSFSHLLQ